MYEGTWHSTKEIHRYETTHTSAKPTGSMVKFFFNLTWQPWWGDSDGASSEWSGIFARCRHDFFLSGHKEMSGRNWGKAILTVTACRGKIEITLCWLMISNNRSEEKYIQGVTKILVPRLYTYFDRTWKRDINLENCEDQILYTYF